MFKNKFIRRSFFLFILILLGTLIGFIFDLSNAFLVLIVSGLLFLIMSFKRLNFKKSSSIILLAIGLFFLFSARASLSFHIPNSNDVTKIRSKIIGFT